MDDDGPGLDPALREAVLQRGVRADEAAPGSGLGLAIVRDLAELYGGSIPCTNRRRAASAPALERVGAPARTLTLVGSDPDMPNYFFAVTSILVAVLAVPCTA